MRDFQRLRPVKPDQERLGCGWWLGQVAIVVLAGAIALWAGPPSLTSDWERLHALEARVEALEEDCR